METRKWDRKEARTFLQKFQNLEDDDLIESEYSEEDALDSLDFPIGRCSAEGVLLTLSWVANADPRNMLCGITVAPIIPIARVCMCVSNPFPPRP